MNLFIWSAMVCFWNHYLGTYDGKFRKQQDFLAYGFLWLTRWSGARVGVGMLRIAGDFQVSNFKNVKCISPTCRLFKFQNVKKSQFQIPEFRSFTFQSFKFSTWSNSHIENTKVRYTDLPNISEFKVLRYEHNMFRGCSHHFLVFLKHSCDKYGVRGSTFGHIFGHSKKCAKKYCKLSGIIN